MRIDAQQDAVKHSSHQLNTLQLMLGVWLRSITCMARVSELREGIGSQTNHHLSHESNIFRTATYDTKVVRCIP